jgi:hypothetical protein
MSVSFLGSCTPKERALISTEEKAGVGLRDDPDGVAKGKVSASSRNQTPVIQPTAESLS